MPDYIIKRGSLHEQFQQSRAKIQIFGGGFGNGKTAAGVVKALRLADGYPKSNGLIARSTYPKLNDTIRKEFLKWCPKEWIKSFPMSVNASNTCTTMKGSEINFRYIAQQGKTEEQTTSNLLSATYDWILVDQMEDPEISYKDFLDLLGRLRGNATYKGDDPTMPRTGPRWMLILCNPTRNWLYQKIVKPYHDYVNNGTIAEDLLVLRTMDGEVIRDDLGNPRLLMEVFEGPTHINAHNLGEDFIQLLESSYKGQMRDRFLLGKWAAYEGLIYKEWNDQVHYIPQSEMYRYLLNQIEEHNYVPTFVEGYDFGLSSPSCYLLGIVDMFGNVLNVDGYYKSEYNLNDQAKRIKEIRTRWSFDGRFDIDTWIKADPDIFRRKSAGGKIVGKSVAELFGEEDSSLRFTRGNNDVKNGIAKVQQYVNAHPGHKHPITGDTPAPYIYFATELSFVGDEMGGYFWRKNDKGAYEDEPVSHASDHSLDTVKYQLSDRPSIGNIVVAKKKQIPAYLFWHEQEPKIRHG